MSHDQTKPVALLAGCSTGLGAALAHHLAERYHLILLSSHSARLEKLDDELRAKGHESTLVVFDFATQIEQIEGMVAALWQRFNRLDLLCGLSAAMVDASPLAYLEPSQMQKMLNVNFIAPYRLMRACDAPMRQIEKASLLMIGGNMTIAGQNNAFTAGFDATKTALSQMVRQYAGELGQSTLKAGLVLPAEFDSRLRRRIYPGQSTKELSSPEVQSAQLAKIILEDQWKNGAEIKLN